MTWEPIDFEGITALDKSLVEKLHSHLQEEESRFGYRLLDIAHAFKGLPALSESNIIHLKMKEAVDLFINNINNYGQIPGNKEDKNIWQTVIKETDMVFWDYISLLEGSITELFQQLRVIDVESWNQTLLEVADNLKSLFEHRIDETIEYIERCDDAIWSNSHLKTPWTVSQLFQFKKEKALDSDLVKNLKQTKIFLNTNYEDFFKRFGEYNKLNLKVEQHLQKIREFSSLRLLEPDQQQQYLRVSRLIKFWELDRKQKKLSQYSFQRFFAYEFTIDKFLVLFKDYFQHFKTTLFNKSRLLKSSLTLRFDAEGRHDLSDLLKKFQAELHAFSINIATYRELLLRTDANPYIRSRLGFTEWIVAPEPHQTKQLLELVFDIENLDKLYASLIKSIDESSIVKPDEKPEELKYEILRTIYKMEQPLSSHLRLTMHAQHLVSLLEKYDELGSFAYDSVEFVEEVFSKAMRADWKYHALNEIPKFHQLYAIHIGIAGLSEERHHRNRFHRFKRLIQQIESWIQKGIIYKHAHEIELDMQDIKGYLQDFFAHVQRLSAENATAVALTPSYIQMQEFKRQLLEYRYLFSSFFYQICQIKPEGTILRNRFLFVDQYFESIESKLHVMRRDRV